MLCPHCKNTTLAMTERQGIEIDYCPTCRGIWLDRGELDRLIERAERESAPPAFAPHREKPHSKDYARSVGYGDRASHEHRKKPKSLLGELFDF